jgi:hypothetical protein
MRIIPTLRPTRPRLIVFSIPACDWAGLMFVLQKRIGTDCRANTEAEHYNPHFFIPQSTKLENCGMCAVTTITAV